MAAADTQAQHELKLIRDTIESIWVAIILAFVLRAFVIEAFVIPTGSMAPTLLGQHFDMQCPSCGYQFAFAAPERDIPHGGLLAKQTVAGARCPNCQTTLGDTLPPSGGDRVLVLKYLYHFLEPQRWDVVVFKNPQDNRIMFIKRLLGLPGETLEIVHGDVFIKKPGEKEYQVATKPKAAQDAMWQLIFNNDYQPDYSKATGAPRWEPAPGDKARWKAVDAGRAFDFAGGRTATLEFHADRRSFLPHYGYNLPTDEDNRISSEKDLVTDLRLSCLYVPTAAASSVSLGLTSFSDEFSVDLASDGKATIHYNTLQGVSKQTIQLPPLTPGRGYELALEHADLGVRFYVDDSLVFQSNPEHYQVTYHDLVNRLNEPMRIRQPQVTLQADGGPCQLRHIKVMRDVYYTSTTLDLNNYETRLGDVAKLLGISRGSGARSGSWGGQDNPITLARGKGDLDEFFMLGDNSPLSADSRMWTSAAPTLRLWKDPAAPHTLENLQYQLGTVPRYNLMGRAFFVYWPAGHRLPMLVPAVPNVGQMRMIR